MRRPWIVSWGLGAVAFGGASLLVPLYIVRLGASPLELGILASTAAIIGAPGAILFGRLASRASHRRQLVLVTLATATAALVLIPFLDHVPAVILTNAALWFVVASVGPVVTMLVVEDAPEATWSTQIGILNKFYGYGWAGGLVLGMVVPTVGARFVDPAMIDRLLFFLLAGIASVSTVTAAWTLPRSDREDAVASDPQARRIARLLANSTRGVRGATFVFPANRLYWATRGFRLSRLRGRFRSPFTLYLIAAGLFFAGFAVFWAPLPHLLAGIGLESGPIFGLYVISSLAGAVLYEPVGRLATDWDTNRLTAGALGIRGLLFPLVAVAAGVGIAGVRSVVLGVLLLSIGVTWAVIAVLGTTIVTRLAPSGLKAEALGSYVAIGAVGGGLGSIVGGWLATNGFLLAFLAAGGLVSLGAVIVFGLHSSP